MIESKVDAKLDARLGSFEARIDAKLDHMMTFLVDKFGQGGTPSVEPLSQASSQGYGGISSQGPTLLEPAPVCVSVQGQGLGPVGSPQERLEERSDSPRPLPGVPLARLASEGSTSLRDARVARYGEVQSPSYSRPPPGFPGLTEYSPQPFEGAGGQGAFQSCLPLMGPTGRGTPSLLRSRRLPCAGAHQKRRSCRFWRRTCLDRPLSFGLSLARGMSLAMTT
jgi:hypothetical protein